MYFFLQIFQTTDGIPTISRDISDLTQQLNALQNDVNRNKDEIARLEALRKARVSIF